MRKLQSLFIIILLLSILSFVMGAGVYLIHEKIAYYVTGFMLISSSLFTLFLFALELKSDK